MEKPNPNAALTGFILGIVSLVAWLLPIIGIPVAIVGLVFSIKGSKTSGIVMNIIGLVLAAINSALGAVLFS